MRVLDTFTETTQDKKITGEIDENNNNIVYVVRHLEGIPDTDTSFLRDKQGKTYKRKIVEKYIGTPISVYEMI